LTGVRLPRIIVLLCIRVSSEWATLTQRSHSATSDRANAKIHTTVDRVERELKDLIGYLNDEVVPAVRVESTRALRVAANKLAKLADYMDQAKKR
jgi:hypothetical protein